MSLNQKCSKCELSIELEGCSAFMKRKEKKLCFECWRKNNGIKYQNKRIRKLKERNLIVRKRNNNVRDKNEKSKQTIIKNQKIRAKAIQKSTILDMDICGIISNFMGCGKEDKLLKILKKTFKVKQGRKIAYSKDLYFMNIGGFSNGNYDSNYNMISVSYDKENPTKLKLWLNNDKNDVKEKKQFWKKTIEIESEEDWKMFSTKVKSMYSVKDITVKRECGKWVFNPIW